MILKNLAAICNAHKRIFLYEGRKRSSVQWAGDGKAFYPLHGIPELDSDTIQTIFSVPEKQRSKYDIQVKALPGLDFQDVPDRGEVQLRPEELSIGYEDAVLYPVRTRRGLMFYNPIYLKPLNDKLGAIEMYERETSTGVIYFAAKAGAFLEAIIMPEDVNEEKLLRKLQDLTGDLETTLHYQTPAEDAAQIKVDTDTGEVIA